MTRNTVLNAIIIVHIYEMVPLVAKLSRAVPDECKWDFPVILLNCTTNKLRVWILWKRPLQHRTVIICKVWLITENYIFLFLVLPAFNPNIYNIFCKLISNDSFWIMKLNKLWLSGLNVGMHLYCMHMLYSRYMHWYSMWSKLIYTYITSQIGVLYAIFYVMTVP